MVKEGQNIIVHSNQVASSQTNIDSPYFSIFSRNLIIVLSYVQAVMSCLAIFSQIVGMSYPLSNGVLAYGSSGIWCGMLFGISGTFGIWAGYHPSGSAIIANLVFAMSSACICIPHIIGSVMCAIVIRSYGHGFPSYGTKALVTLWMFIGLAVVGFAHALLSLSSSACTVICCHTKSASEGGTIITRDLQSKVLPISDKPIIVWISLTQIITSLITTSFYFKITIAMSVVGRSYPDYEIGYLGIAIWCAVPFFTLCAASGVWSWLSPSKWSVITFMVFALMSTCLSLVSLGISLDGFTTSKDANLPYSLNDYSSRPYGNLQPLNPDGKPNSWNEYIISKLATGYWGSNVERKINFGLFLAHTLIALTQLMISINWSAMACEPICNPTRNTKSSTMNEDIE